MALTIRSPCCRWTPGNIGGYYPECNALIPLWHYAEGSKTPAAKSIPVRVQKIAMEYHSA